MLADINECTTDANDCNENAICIDMVDSIECVCAPGFIGDGRINCTGMSY